MPVNGAFVPCVFAYRLYSLAYMHTTHSTTHSATHSTFTDGARRDLQNDILHYSDELVTIEQHQQKQIWGH